MENTSMAAMKKLNTSRNIAEEIPAFTITIPAIPVPTKVAMLERIEFRLSPRVNVSLERISGTIAEVAGRLNDSTEVIMSVKVAIR